MNTTLTMTLETFSAMRKILFAALAALALVGCRKALPEPVKAIILTSEEPSTRTGWDGTTIEWTAGDVISMAYSVSGEWVGPNIYRSEPVAESGLTASFTVPGDFPTNLVGAHHFYALYPALEGTDFSDAPHLSTSVPQVQTPGADTFDPAADLMVASSTDDWRSLPASPIPMIWSRLTAHGDITLKNLALEADEKVQSIALQAQDGAELTGDVVLDISDPTDFVTDGVPSVTVQADNLSVDTAGNLRFWVSIFPVELTELTVTVTTDQATYRKVFTGISKTFAQNARNILGISMEGAERITPQPETEYYVKVTATPDDWAGDYLIVYEEGAVAFDGGRTSLDAVGNTISVTIDDGKIEATDETRAAQFTIASSDGSYSIQSASGLYIGRSGDSNGLNTGNSPLGNTLSMAGTDVDIVAAGGTHLRYNKANDQRRFRYFKSSTYTGQQPIQLYKLGAGSSSGDPDTFNAVVTTLDATGITSSKATLNARYTGVSTQAAPQDVGFYFGTSTRDMSFVGNVAASGSSGTFSVPLTELTPNQKYYFYATMSVWNPETNRYETIVGETLAFTTSASEIIPAGLDWAELPALDYTHHGTGGDYYIDNNHYSLYADGSLYVAHHWTPVSAGDGHYLRNYTTCWSSEYKCPLWVAAPLHASYYGNAERKDRYKADPDIPSSIQYAASSSGNSAYTRGHMLASNQRLLNQDVNDQVFYYTNIAPQASFMNGQGTGWNNLEDYIMGEKGRGGYNCSDTLYVVIGNYFEDYTDGNGLSATKQKDTFMGSNVQIPTMLYVVALRTKMGNLGKSVKDCTADELQCAAFCRAQNSGNNKRKVTANDMITVAELEQLTGFTFFANVPNAPKNTAKASDWGL